MLSLEEERRHWRRLLPLLLRQLLLWIWALRGRCCFGERERGRACAAPPVPIPT
jgi:hypothetical protein